MGREINILPIMFIRCVALVELTHWDLVQGLRGGRFSSIDVASVESMFWSLSLVQLTEIDSAPLFVCCPCTEWSNADLRRTWHLKLWLSQSHISSYFNQHLWCRVFKQTGNRKVKGRILRQLQSGYEQNMGVWYMLHVSWSQGMAL